MLICGEISLSYIVVFTPMLMNWHQVVSFSILKLEFALDTVSCDFEAALYGSLKDVWPDVRVRPCAFHLVSAASRKLKQYFKVNHVYANPFTTKIFNLVAALPYVRWTTGLVNVFLSELEEIGNKENKSALKVYHTAKKGERREAKKKYETAQRNMNATVKYVKYLRTYFLSPTSGNGFKKWTYTSEETDYTNNICESANHLLKSWIGTKNIRTYSKTIGILHDFMADWIATPAEQVHFDSKFLS